MTFILSQSNKYVINSTYIQKQTSLGKDKFFKEWKKLQELGYIKRKDIREKGQVKGTHWIVNENPLNMGRLPKSEKQESGNSESDNPDSNNNQENNNQLYKKTVTGEHASTALSPSIKKEINTMFDEAKEVYDHICSVAANYGCKTYGWDMTDEDKLLILGALSKYDKYKNRTSVRMLNDKIDELASQAGSDVNYMGTRFFCKKIAGNEIKNNQFLINKAKERIRKRSLESPGSLVNWNPSDKIPVGSVSPSQLPPLPYPLQKHS
ncbi:hypothetical protein EMN46_01710 [Ancylomarina sp. 16SWW S1-10-2]|nr:hypothetical protein [Ancylomarina sp. 16SWW S1-10-2]